MISTVFGISINKEHLLLAMLFWQSKMQIPNLPKASSTATSYFSFEEAKIGNPVIPDFFNQRISRITDDKQLNIMNSSLKPDIKNSGIF